ncbi:MAG: hypothetical protein DRQ43_06865, partial [Gammaproteobacteria bacterium]
MQDLPGSLKRMKINKSKIIIHSLRVLSWIPLPVIHGLGSIIGSLIYWLPNNIRRVAFINLKLCLPELSVKERKHLLRQSLIESSK